jgi:hypothetical protein
MKRRPKILQLFDVRTRENMSRFRDIPIARAPRISGGEALGSGRAFGL